MSYFRLLRSNFIKIGPELSDEFRGMKKLIFKCAISTFVSVFGVLTHAQVDASSRLLLNPGPKNKTVEVYDSERYTVRPKTKTPVVIDFDKQTPKVAAPKTDTPKIETEVEVKHKIVQPAPQPISPAAAALPEPVSAVPEPVATEPDYENWLSEEDPRRNTIEIEVAPGMMYNASNSNYWFHQHFSASPSFEAGFQVWFLSNFGIKTSYTSSFGASIDASVANKDALEVEHHFFSAGLRYKKIFGLSKTSRTFIFGIDFDNYQFEVPGDATQRIKLNTQGLKLSVETILPEDASTAWVVGAEFLPSLAREEKATGISVDSGNDLKTFALGLSVGKKYSLTRKNQFFWKLYHRVENSIYGGTASAVDPVTSRTPAGVSVQNSTTLFQFGFLWGR